MLSGLANIHTLLLLRVIAEHVCATYIEVEEAVFNDCV